MEFPLTRDDLESRLEYLEEVDHFTIDALEMAASLGDLQSSIQKQDEPHAILFLLPFCRAPLHELKEGGSLGESLTIQYWRYR